MSVADQIVAEAQRQGVDPPIALEVARRESGFNQGATGAAGEIGVFQLKPTTAAMLGVNPYDLAQNIQGGVTYLRQLLSQFGDPAKAVAAYNCGPGCVSSTVAYGADWFAHIPASTKSYVNDILGAVQSAYTPVFNPGNVNPSAPFPVSSGATLFIPPVAPPPSGGGIWGTLAFAVAVIFGIGFVLSES
jgi:soluble lytic murein transglycosylase-like protein